MNLKNLRKKQAELLNQEFDIPKLFAKDAMTLPTCFYEDDSIDKIISRLKEEDCDVCIVIDKDKRFVGEIDDEDLVKIMAHTALKEPITQILDRGYRRELNWKKAKDLAKPHKNVVSKTTPINEVLKIVYKKSYDNIIVVDEKNRVLGVITPSSLLRLLSKY
ncbi:MAG: CBS domain-containing protein [Nanoarchaeota archaeon]|nr:CBS domain-containing protein [Nanoarchaeota archaeon]